MKPFHFALPVAAAVVVACGGDVQGAALPANVASARSAVDSARASSARRVAAVKPVAWTIRIDGAGPLRPGMTLARAVIEMDGDLWTHDRSLSCSAFHAARAPGVAFVFLDRRLARIDVDSGASVTAEGVKIGDTEQRVRAAYPDRVTMTEDKGTRTHYLIVTPADQSDSARRIVFETDGDRVTRFRTGILPAVEWAEPCN